MFLSERRFSRRTTPRIRPLAIRRPGNSPKRKTSWRTSKPAASRRKSSKPTRTLPMPARRLFARRPISGAAKRCCRPAPSRFRPSINLGRPTRSAEAKAQAMDAALTQLRAPMAVQEVKGNRRLSMPPAPWSIWSDGGLPSAVSRRRSGGASWMSWRPGETMAAGAPVVSLLPPENILVRFFVAETDLATVHREIVALHCAARLICPRQSHLCRRRPNIRRRSSTANRAGKSWSIHRSATGQRRGGAADGQPGRGASGQVEDAAMTGFVIDVHDLHKSFGSRKGRGLLLQVAAGEIALPAPLAAVDVHDQCCAPSTPEDGGGEPAWLMSPNWRALPRRRLLARP